MPRRQTFVHFSIPDQVRHRSTRSYRDEAFAAAWRTQPKWVVSRSLKSVGPNARLVEDDLEAAIRELKAERDGEIEVAGPGRRSAS